jgi:hypothetical protein
MLTATVAVSISSGEGPVLRAAAVATVSAMLACAAPAAAKPRGPVTFSGSCALSGTVVQDPPMTAVPSPGRAFAAATGTCSGTLTDRRGRTRELTDAPARYAASAAGVVGCGGGSAEGSGVLALRGRRIGFAFSEVRGPGFAAVRLEGARGGSAAGQATASADEDPAAIAAACAGPGLRSVGIDITLATTPSISG